MRHFEVEGDVVVEKKSEIPSLSYGLQKSGRTDDSSLQQDFLLSHYSMKKTNDSGYRQQITEGPAHPNITEPDVYETAFCFREFIDRLPGDWHKGY